jgi:hypothetical protein
VAYDRINNSFWGLERYREKTRKGRNDRHVTLHIRYLGIHIQSARETLFEKVKTLQVSSAVFLQHDGIGTITGSSWWATLHQAILPPLLRSATAMQQWFEEDLDDLHNIKQAGSDSCTTNFASAHPRIGGLCLEIKLF